MADLSPELAAKIQSLEGGYGDNPGRYFVALAGAWREAGETGRAEEILRENLKRFPGLSAHVLLGRCLADRGAFQEAANEFHYVLSIDAQNLIALRTLAEMAAAGGRRAEAERWYNELLAVDPMNAEARASLAELARGAADASVADQPVQVGTGWAGASEPAPVAGGAAEGAEFGMIDLGAPDASSADASGAAADDDADGEWGDLPLELSDEPQPASAAPAGDFDAFGFGSVDLAAGQAEADETGAVGEWLDADARQDPGESAGADRGGLAPLGDEDMVDATLAGADLPFLDADDSVPADLPLPDTHAPARDFPDFDPPSPGDEGPGAFTVVPAEGTAGLPPFTAVPTDASAPRPFHHGEDQADHPDHEVDAEVVTETMAELYAAQGLLQQSADVYRELIRQRGEEPGLVRRLAEIEARMQPEPAAEAPADDAPDWLASVDAFAMGGAAASMAAIQMTAEPDPQPQPEPVSEPGVEPEPVPAGSFEDRYVPTEPLGDDPLDAAGPSVALFDEAVAATADDAGDADADSFADSFQGGFDGVEAQTPEPAFAAAAPVSEVDADEDREQWEAPTVRETEAVGFDLIVVEEDGDEVAAPPEVVADMSADWAIAAAPLEDHQDAAEELASMSAPPAAAAGTTTMRAYFAGLLAWNPGQSAAAPAAVEEPAFAPPPADDEPASVEPAAEAEEEQWAEVPAPPLADAADEPWTETPAASASHAAEEPWSEAPAAPAADADGAPWNEAPAASPAGAEEEPWTEAPAAPVADADDAPWNEAPAASAAGAEEEPWTEAPAAPLADADDEPWNGAPVAPAGEAPAYDLPVAGAAEPADEPWADAPQAEGDDLSLMDLSDEPWAAPRAPEPARIDAFTLSDEIATEPAAAEEALPWEQPAEPAAAEAPPAADPGGGFSFEDFFAGGGPPPAAEGPITFEPEPVPEPEAPSGFVPSQAFEPTPPPPAPVPGVPAAPAASAPTGGQDEDDEDLESFQAWLQSLKR